MVRFCDLSVIRVVALSFFLSFVLEWCMRVQQRVWGTGLVFGCLSCLYSFLEGKNIGPMIFGYWDKLVERVHDPFFG